MATLVPDTLPRRPRHRAASRAGDLLATLCSPLRRPADVGLHAVLVVAASYGAFWLRFDGEIPDSYVRLWRDTLPWVVASRMMTLLPFGVFASLWKYTGLWDIRNIVVAVAASSALIWVCDQAFAWGYPRSIHPLAAVLTIGVLAGLRLVARQSREVSWSTSVPAPRRILVVGAGDAGETIARDMRVTESLRMVPVGFVDDDLRKVGRRINGVPVLGTPDQLPRFIENRKADEVLIAMPSAPGPVLREVFKALEPLNVRITTLATLRESVDGCVHASQIRQLSIEDLVSRAPVTLDPALPRRLIAGRRTLVTGAGGSIGSQLCQQLAQFDPARLVLLDRCENSLLATAQLTGDGSPACETDVVVADITDSTRLAAVFRHYRPDVIFHAAAHKHVPLMECNPCEAVKNNVAGSRLLAEAAHRYGIRRFVLVSTDKAVNPASVMGATKRIAELVVHEIAARSRTRFVVVRLGNVLGSNGSVVPRFLQQIQRGGPVTVTHPEVCRYFMLIPEAVQLLLQAAALDATPGGAYVLDMGDPIKLVDLARSLIRLAGRVPDQDIAISFTGLRPGEKLSEELVGRDEAPEPSGVAGITRLSLTVPARHDCLRPAIAELERRARRGDSARVLDHIRAILPGFAPRPLGAAA